MPLHRPANLADCFWQCSISCRFFWWGSAWAVAGAFAGAVAGVGMLVMFGLLGLFVFVVFNAAPVIIIIRQAFCSNG